MKPVCHSVVVESSKRTLPLAQRAAHRWIGLRSAAAVCLSAALLGPAAAEEGVVVVVAPDPGGTPVPVGPDEKVSVVNVVRLPGGVSVAVVRVEKMPPKPDFNIITPDGVSHPYKNGDTGEAGITVTHEPQIVHDRDGRTWYRVVSCFRRGGREYGCAKVDYPCGSQLIPDPPQPPGTAFVCPDAAPAEDEIVDAVLASLGLPADAAGSVWRVPTGELYVSHDATSVPQVLTFAIEPSQENGEAAADPADSAVDDASPVDATSSQGSGEQSTLTLESGEEAASRMASELDPCGFGVIGVFPAMLAGLCAFKSTARRRVSAARRFKA